MPEILIPDSVTWELPELPLDVIRFNRSDSLEGLDSEALVTWGLNSGQLKQLLEMPKLRWVQTFTAGINNVLDLNPSQDILVSNGKGLHDAPTAELAVTLLLSAVRRMHLHRDHQHNKNWDRRFYNQAVNAPDTQLMTLEGANVLILGMGAIGLEIARRLQPFGASVEGVASASGDRDGFVTHAIEDLELVLPSADAVVMVLPDTPATHKIMNAQRLALLSPRTWIVNVGRGSAIDETALIAALEQHQIGGAALDVTDLEPLPTDSKLWTLENCIITPHIAGGGPNLIGKANALLGRNAEKFVAGEELENLVSREKGY
jgi:phosphoglycerate dehydrogenase-like enzyme